MQHFSSVTFAKTSDITSAMYQPYKPECKSVDLKDRK